MILLAENFTSGITKIFEGITTKYISLYKKDPLLLEELEKVKEGYTPNSLGNGIYLISTEIKERLSSHGLFTDVMTIALSETISILDKEIGKGKYVIEVSIETDYEFPKWRYTVIAIKTSIKDSKYIIQLWKKIEEIVRKNIRSINADIEEINKINRDLDINIEILE